MLLLLEIGQRLALSGLLLGKNDQMINQRPARIIDQHQFLSKFFIAA
jgi:hypothetical protein